MRLYIKVSKNFKPIPFSYQHLLTGTLHKWIGQNNEEHGRNSLYCFSWLQGAKSTKNGIMLTDDSYFFISVYDETLLKKIVRGILDDPSLFHGSKVLDIQLKDVPQFSAVERFITSSPIFIREKQADNNKHVTYLDKNFETLLTENMMMKLNKAGLNPIGISIELDKSYPTPKTKMISYNGIDNKTSLVPVIIKGTPEQIAFAWTVGIGHSTGIGFGSLK